VKETPAPKKPEPEQTVFAQEVAELVKELNDDSIWLNFDDQSRLRLMVSVIFGADRSDFKGLSSDTMASNEKKLGDVANILKRVKYSGIIIEGHSNPTTPEGQARDREENELRELSRLRALTVVDELIKKYGVDLNNVVVQGAGSSRMEAPYNDTRNNWKNRRVEFILIQ
jgi:outer membrane protein OmpA-like peptidoglycan-associated protein